MQQNPEEQATESESRARILECLQLVPLARRAVLVMHDLDGFSAQEIASTLDIPLNTAYSRLRTARTEFKTAHQRMAQADAMTGPGRGAEARHG